MRKKLLRYLGCTLVVGGVLALAWYGYFRWEMIRVQRAASDFIQSPKKREAKSLAPPSIPHATVILPPRPGEPVARLEIPRVHLSAAVLEGTSSKILRVAAGHIGGTALLGSGGNIGIAAHRDTFFRPLRDIRPNDEIMLRTSYGTFRYVVHATEIVGPTDVRVLRPTPDPELTLVTCYPFTYIGSAPKRFVVHARKEG